MTDEVRKSFEHPGEGREALRGLVMRAEKEAEKELGSPVVRSHRFLHGTGLCEFIWKRKPE